MIDDRLKEEVRIQDVVAKTARVNLRDTVRVLRATAHILNIMGEKEAVTRLNVLLYKSAEYGGFPSPLHSKPDAIAVDACNDVYDAVVAEVGEGHLQALFELTRDPYYETKVSTGRVADGA